MSRSTQYIGLTASAKEWIQTHLPTKMDSDTFTHGMFDEHIPLSKWEVTLNSGKRVVVRECVQEVPWSSGPMIFTCLEVDFGNGGKTKIWEWVHDPDMEGVEFDETAGRLWV